MKLDRKLLVEGNDDLHVVWGLLEHHNFPETFTVEEKGGIDHLMKVLPVHAKESGIKALGAVIDADTRIGARWDAMKVSLHALGYACPDDLPADGLILEGEEMPRFGAWLMPDNAISGMLEDFVGHLVPEGDALWQHARDVLTSIPAGLAGFKPIHVSKAHIHTWLAWQEDPGTPMGLAITKKYLDPDAGTVAPFLDWLERLFVR